ncbi:MAG: hypothetical protein GXO18_04220 [Aquificae bacterium]|nr:hypothetical protein [Aquificota bacterium]
MEMGNLITLMWSITLTLALTYSLTFGIGFNPKSFTKWGFEFFGVTDIMKDLFQCFMPTCNMIYPYDFTVYTYNSNRNDEQKKFVVAAGGLGDPDVETGYGVLLYSPDGFRWYPILDEYYDPQNIRFFERKLWAVASGQTSQGNKTNIVVAVGDEGDVVIAAYNAEKGRWDSYRSGKKCGDDMLDITYVDNTNSFVAVGDNGRVCVIKVGSVAFDNDPVEQDLMGELSVNFESVEKFTLRDGNGKKINLFLYGVEYYDNDLIIVGDLGGIFKIENVSSDTSSWEAVRLKVGLNPKQKDADNSQSGNNSSCKDNKGNKPSTPEAKIYDPIYDVVSLGDKGEFLAVGKNGLIIHISNNYCDYNAGLIRLNLIEEVDLGTSDYGWVSAMFPTLKGISVNRFGYGSDKYTVYAMVSREGLIFLTDDFKKGWAVIAPDPAYRISLNGITGFGSGFVSGSLGLVFSVIQKPVLTAYPSQIVVPLVLDGSISYIRVNTKNNTFLPVMVDAIRVYNYADYKKNCLDGVFLSDDTTLKGEPITCKGMSSVDVNIVDVNCGENTSLYVDSALVNPGETCEVLIRIQPSTDITSFNENYFILEYETENPMTKMLIPLASVGIQLNVLDKEQAVSEAQALGGCSMGNRFNTDFILVLVLAVSMFLLRRFYMRKTPA